MDSLTDKKVLIVGLGRSGIAAATFAVQRGARVTVTDAKPEEELSKAIDALETIPLIKKLGGHDPALFAKADMVVVSPGVSVNLEGLEAAREAGIPVIGEMELAVREIEKPIVAITGTNGKTTTATLVGHLMDACGIANCVAGNIGKPITGLIYEANRVDRVVLEVSSFQLETTPSLKAAIAVWLNATPDHLDRHRSFEEYVAMKTRLFAPLSAESWGIYNVADAVVAEAVASSSATLIPFDPSSTRRDGGWYEDGRLCVDVPSRGRYHFDLDEVAMVGAHNRENMLAAILATLLAGGDAQDIQAGLRSFKGLPHRLELVANMRGVRFYNDSKGTNVGATLKALASFDEPVVLIAGGQEKGTGFVELKDEVARRVKKMILIGEAADRLIADVGDVVDMSRANSMEEAVSTAWRAADPGDVILLSPACASFDMFTDYAHRGDSFKDAVRQIVEEYEEVRWAR